MKKDSKGHWQWENIMEYVTFVKEHGFDTFGSQALKLARKMQKEKK